MTQAHEKGATRSPAPAGEALALPPQRSLPEIVAERLVEAMRAGVLSPGERLVETVLAAKLQVSRGPLREALKALEANRLVESRRGRGTYVRAVSPDEVAQMIAVRALLEGLAARLAAARATPAMLEQLRRLHRRIEIAARSGETGEWRDLDWSFHELVCTHSGNDFLLVSWRSISNLVRIYLHQNPAYLTNREGILGNHQAFLDAIAAKDPDRAEAVFRTTLLKTGFLRLGMAVPASLEAYIDQDIQVRTDAPRPVRSRKGEVRERRGRPAP